MHYTLPVGRTIRRWDDSTQQLEEIVTTEIAVYGDDDIRRIYCDLERVQITLPTEAYPYTFLRVHLEDLVLRVA